MSHTVWTDDPAGDRELLEKALADGSYLDIGPLLAWIERQDGPPPPGWRLQSGPDLPSFHYGCMAGTIRFAPDYDPAEAVVPQTQ